MSTEPEDDSSRQAHVVLRGIGSGVRVREFGHQVLRLNDADSEMTVHPHIEPTSGGHGELVLRGQWRAANISAVGGEGYRTGTNSAKESLDEWRDSFMVAERQARASEKGVHGAA